MGLGISKMLMNLRDFMRSVLARIYDAALGQAPNLGISVKYVGAVFGSSSTGENVNQDGRLDFRILEP